MPKYQKLSEKDGFITFNVISDDNKVEEVTSILLDGETEEQMMSRHAHHHNDELKKKQAVSVVDINSEPEPAKDAVAKKDLPFVENLGA